MRFAKKFTAELIGRMGYEFRRKTLPFPQPMLELIQLALACCATRCDPTFVQIGACDGKSGDAATSIVQSTKFVKAVFVEPIRSNFEQLVLHYKSSKYVCFEQAAVGEPDGTRTMYRVKNEGRWVGSSDARQWSSFNHKHLLRHGVLHSEIEEIDVPTVTLATLLRKH